MAAKKKVTRARKSGPSASELVLQAMATSMERHGLSLAALMKILAAQGYDVDKNKARVKIAIRSLVKKGTLVQNKGVGASASFRINNKLVGPKGKKPVAKRRAGKKPRRRTKKAKAVAAKKRAAAKKSPKRSRKARTSKKAGKGRKKSPKRRRRVARKASEAKRAPAKKAARRTRRKAA